MPLLRSERLWWKQPQLSLLLSLESGEAETLATQGGPETRISRQDRTSQTKGSEHPSLCKVNDGGIDSSQ